jgi:hypothetical protein
MDLQGSPGARPPHDEDPEPDPRPDPVPTTWTGPEDESSARVAF